VGDFRPSVYTGGTINLLEEICINRLILFLTAPSAKFIVPFTFTSKNFLGQVYESGINGSPARCMISSWSSVADFIAASSVMSHFIRLVFSFVCIPPLEDDKSSIIVILAPRRSSCLDISEPRKPQPPVIISAPHSAFL
jgi:hypothetical protein